MHEDRGLEQGFDFGNLVLEGKHRTDGLVLFALLHGFAGFFRQLRHFAQALNQTFKVRGNDCPCNACFVGVFHGVLHRFDDTMNAIIALIINEIRDCFLAKNEVGATINDRSVQLQQSYKRASARYSSCS